MGQWELWRQTTTSGGIVHTFLPADARPPRDSPEWGPDDWAEPELIWTVEARSTNDAMSRFHAYMGYEAYRPMLRDDGTPYPEDEAPR